MDDSERAALVEELADLMQDHAPEISAPYEAFWEALAHNGVMPIIERLLAERDLDKMLDSVHPTCRIAYVGYEQIGEWEAVIIWGANGEKWYQAEGTGTTRTAAVRNAVAAAWDQTP